MPKKVINAFKHGSLVWDIVLKNQKLSTYVYKIKGGVGDRCYTLKLFAGGHVLEDSLVLNDCAGLLVLNNNSFIGQKVGDLVFELREFDTHKVSYSRYLELDYSYENGILYITGRNISGMDMYMPTCWVVLHKGGKPVDVLTALFPGVVPAGAEAYTRVSVALKDFDDVELISNIIV